LEEGDVMAYNFPMNYQQQFYPQNYQQPQQTVQQIQSGGFIPVPSEDVARNYPVAPGNSVTFKNENAPYVYTKTMGFSQLDRPIFEKYKLVREEDPVPSTEPIKECHCSNELEKLKEEFGNEFDKLWSEIDVLREQIPKPTASKKKESGGD
jgi:hypothetical protein